jgi:hypothetical protein
MNIFKHSSSVVQIAALLVSLAGSLPASAQTSSDDRWKFTVAPYMMGASLSGTTVVQGRPADVDVRGSDIFDNLDFGFMTMAVARKGDWGVLGDMVVVDLSVPVEMPPGEFQPTLGIFAVQGVRRLNDSADLTFGLRWNHVNAVLNFPAVGIELERSRDWVDPVVGVVFRTPEERRWHATLIADAGGFGVGSDFTWQVFPSAGVNLTSWASLEFGWRFLATDYKTGEGADRFEYDILYQGPVVGVAFRF